MISYPKQKEETKKEQSFGDFCATYLVGGLLLWMFVEAHINLFEAFGLL